MRIPDEHPVDPPDAHGELARWYDLLKQKLVPCQHDDDECTFTKHCPLYKPTDFQFWDHDTVPEDVPMQITCKILVKHEAIEMVKTLNKAIEKYQVDKENRSLKN